MSFRYFSGRTPGKTEMTGLLFILFKPLFLQLFLPLPTAPYTLLAPRLSLFDYLIPTKTFPSLGIYRD